MQDRERVREAVREARRVLFVTGAGLSADSGLPTYRGVGGLYHGTDTEDEAPIEVMLSGPMFERHPTKVWRYLAQIERACRGALPNAGHRAIAELAERCEVVVLTQNVDGLHRDAGSPEVIEIHGTLRRLRCPGCDRVEDPWAFADHEDGPPTCARCGAICRPDVVLFEEMLPADAVVALRRAMSRPFDVVFSVGTTSVFPYIAAPVIHQARSGGLAVEVNPGDTAVSDVVSVRIRGRAADALPGLLAR
jgi:NAD-dependent deacetylase